MAHVSTPDKNSHHREGTQPAWCHTSGDRAGTRNEDLITSCGSSCPQASALSVIMKYFIIHNNEKTGVEHVCWALGLYSLLNLFYSHHDLRCGMTVNPLEDKTLKHREVKVKAAVPKSHS